MTAKNHSPASSEVSTATFEGGSTQGDTTQPPPALQAVGLTKRYDDGTLALDGFSFTMAQGEIFCLLGGNGAGKTTAMNIFLNLAEPTNGRAFVCGIDVTERPMEAKKRLAFVPENVSLYASLTTRQNLQFFAELAGKRDILREDLYMLLRTVGLPERAFEQKLGKLSKGMRQKVAIAIAVIKDAPVMLLDEPTSGLDPKAAADIIQLLWNLKAQGKAILMSTHDVFRAKAIADTVGILKEGRLVMCKRRDELELDDLSQLYMQYMEF